GCERLLRAGTLSGFGERFGSSIGGFARGPRGVRFGFQPLLCGTLQRELGHRPLAREPVGLELARRAFIGSLTCRLLRRFRAARARASPRRRGAPSPPAAPAPLPRRAGGPSRRLQPRRRGGFRPPPPHASRPPRETGTRPALSLPAPRARGQCARLQRLPWC